MLSPCKGIDDSFHTVDSGFRVLNSGFPHSGCRIPKSAGLQNFFFLLGYGFQSLAGLRIPKPMIPDFKNEKLVDSEIRIPLHGAKMSVRAKNGRKRTHVVLKTSLNTEAFSSIR